MFRFVYLSSVVDLSFDRIEPKSNDTQYPNSKLENHRRNGRLFYTRDLDQLQLMPSRRLFLPILTIVFHCNIPMKSSLDVLLVVKKMNSSFNVNVQRNRKSNHYWKVLVSRRVIHTSWFNRERSSHYV